MSEKTPTTDQVQDFYCNEFDSYHGWQYIAEREAEFNRWLNDVKREAAMEGYEKATEHERRRKRPSPSREEIAHALWNLPENSPEITDLNRLNQEADKGQWDYYEARDYLYRQVDAVLALIARQK